MNNNDLDELRAAVAAAEEIRQLRQQLGVADGLVTLYRQRIVELETAVSQLREDNFAMAAKVGGEG